MNEVETRTMTVYLDAMKHSICHTTRAGLSARLVALGLTEVDMLAIIYNAPVPMTFAYNDVENSIIARYPADMETAISKAALTIEQGTIANG